MKVRRICYWSREPITMHYVGIYLYRTSAIVNRVGFNSQQCEVDLRTILNHEKHFSKSRANAFKMHWAHLKTSRREFCPAGCWRLLQLSVSAFLPQAQLIPSSIWGEPPQRPQDDEYLPSRVALSTSDKLDQVGSRCNYDAIKAIVSGPHKKCGNFDTRRVTEV